VNLEYTGDLDCREVQLSQVILNLLNNAFDAISELPNKWVHLESRMNEGIIEIRVIDSGSGIPEELREKILQPFFTTKEVGQGTGLGLSISKGIIESHGGTLSIDIKSQNTCFVIQIPQAKTVQVAA
jgi:signal transduction histidine kinase